MEPLLLQTEKGLLKKGSIKVYETKASRSIDIYGKRTNCFNKLNKKVLLT